MRSWRITLLEHLTAAWHYRWLGLAAAWVVCLCGWLGVAFLPNTYTSTAKVYIDTQTILAPLLKGLAVTVDPDQEIDVMMQTLLTDPKVESVVRATNPKATSMSASQMQDAITRLRNNVSMKTLGAKNLYSIAYSDHDPAYAQSVAQTLESVLIDSNLGGQRLDADQAGAFLNSEIADYHQKLQEADKSRADFKKAHLGYFAVSPSGDQVVDAGAVDTATAAVNRSQNALNDAVGRLNTLRSQLSVTRPAPGNDTPPPVVRGDASAAADNGANLTAAIERLNMLRTQYTDDYPDVVAQKRVIASLQAAQSSGANSMGTQDVSGVSYGTLTNKVSAAESEVAGDRARLTAAQSQLANASKSADEAINVQRQYEDLDRDYQVLQENYRQLVSRREAAKITQAAGDQQSNLVFRVVSPPIKPVRPVAPDRIFWNAAILFLGIGAGGGLSFLLSQFSGRFHSIEQLQQAFDLPTLGAVTLVRTGADALTMLRSSAFFVIGIGLLVVSYLTVLFFFHTIVVDTTGYLL